MTPLPPELRKAAEWLAIPEPYQNIDASIPTHYLRDALEYIETLARENDTIKSAWESDLLQWKTEQSKDWATIAKVTAERDANETLYAILRGICEDVIDWRLELMDNHPAMAVSPHTKNLFDKLNQMYAHPLDDKLLLRTDQIESAEAKLQTAEATIARLTGGLPDAETLAAKWWEQFEQPIKFSELSAAMQSKLKEDASSWLAALSSTGKGK